MREITNNDDIIDSRDVIERIEELQDMDQDVVADATDDERREYAALVRLAADAESEGVVDWQYGETLIRYSYFTDYAKELAQDIGAVNPNAEWPLTYIDWEAAADALKADYATVMFDGVEYYARQG